VFPSSLERGLGPQALLEKIRLSVSPKEGGYLREMFELAWLIGGREKKGVPLRNYEGRKNASHGFEPKERIRFTCERLKTGKGGKIK